MDDRLKEIMASVFELEIKDIHDEVSTDSIAKWDSLHHMNLIAALEEHFDIEFEEDEILDLNSYKLVRLAVQEKLKV